MAGAAIVTGGSGGMGVGICERLAKEGFPVIVHYSGSSEKHFYKTFDTTLRSNVRPVPWEGLGYHAA